MGGAGTIHYKGRGIDTCLHHQVPVTESWTAVCTIGLHDPICVIVTAICVI